MLAQKLNLKEARLIDNVRELSLKEGQGNITVPAPARHVVNNLAMKTPSRTENINPYEAMAGEWTMTTASGKEWDVRVYAASEDDPDYNKILYVTGMMGYDWTMLTMHYSYNNEEGKPEVYIKAGELFAENVNFSGLGVCNVYLYNIDGSDLVPNDMVAEVSSDGNTLDFGANSFYGAVFTSSNEFAGGWFNETGVKMTRVLPDDETGSTENTNPYEAMAGKWAMTTASGKKWNVRVHAATEGDPDYNKVLYVTGMMGYDWTMLTMNYSYNYEEGKPEVYIKAGELFAENVNFSGLGVCNVYLYNIDGSDLVPNDMVAEVSSDGNTLDFGANSFYGAVFTSSNEFAGGWFNETGVKMTRVLPDDETGIDELKSEIGAVKKENSAVYDLSGRRVQKGQKGVFIQNGKVMVQ